MLVFENKGEIDIRGITTFGTSVKVGSSPIGFFGTGLKYAIAVLLRNGCKITIYSGSNRYEFSAKSVLVRGQEFGLVYMSFDVDKMTRETQELAFTTELGKTWKLWQAYRELFCNTQDENGETFIAQRKTRGKKGHTRIIVEGLDEVHEVSDEFILRTEPLYDLSEVDIHEKQNGEKGSVFYYGIRVYTPSKPMKYNYNLKRRMELTEDRTLKYPWSADWAILQSVITSRFPEPISEIVCAPEDYYEAGLDYKDKKGLNPSDVFVAALSTFDKSGGNSTAYEFYNDHAMEHLTNLPKMALSGEQQSILDKSKALLYECGYVDRYAVIVTDMLAENAISNAAGNTIYLSAAVFGRPVEQIAEIIFDSYLQLSMKGGRSWLIQQLIAYSNPDHIASPAVEEKFVVDVFDSGEELFI